MSNLVILRWYDALTKEGVFVNTIDERVLANFEWEPTSHELACAAKQGDVFTAVTVTDTTFTQIVSITK